VPKVIIIGSGFGGSIATLRYLQKGWTVSLNEMGEDWPSTKMRQTQDTKYIYRIMRDYPQDYYSRTDDLRPKLVVAAGMGLGGGSLVYSGIHLRAPTEALENWPSGWRRSDLDFYYDKVEANLHVQTYPRSTSDFLRRQRFAAGAPYNYGYGTTPNPLAMQGCTFCGWCVPNCVFDKKQSMPLTYLARAKLLSGLSIWTQWKATRVTKNGAGYRVYFLPTSGRRDNYHMVNSGSEVYEDCDRVVIACGAIESPALLLRSMPYLNGFGTQGQIGLSIDGQGDGVVGGILPANLPTDSFKGAIMMDNQPMWVWNSSLGRWEQPYVLEDIHSIPVGVGVKYPAGFASADGGNVWGLNFKQKVRGFENRMLGIAIIGKSPSGANISVTNDNGIAVVSGGAYALPAASASGAAYGPAAVDAAKAIITSLGGEVAQTPLDREAMIATVHPSGGNCMGQVVDPNNGMCVYGNAANGTNAGVFVLDGSILPSSTWRNPTHTIMAVVEKALAQQLGTPPAW